MTATFAIAIGLSLWQILINSFGHITLNAFAKLLLYLGWFSHASLQSYTKLINFYSKPKNSDEDTDVDIREWQRNPFRYPLFYSMEMKAKHDSPFIRLKRSEHQERFITPTKSREFN